MRREQDARNHACRDRGEHEVAIDLHPLITRRRRLKIVPTPVVDDILRTAIVGRQAVAAMPVAVRHRTMRCLGADRAASALRTTGATRTAGTIIGATALVGSGMAARAAVIARRVLRERLS